MLLEHPLVGGVVLLLQNIVTKQQTRQLIASIKAVDSGLYIAIDQEGGSVCRLKGEGYSAIPSQYEQCSLGQVGMFAQKMAVDLKDIGVEITLSPVLDVHDESSVIIGQRGRAYSADVGVVSACGKEAIAAYKQYGILTCAKHFPGHGAVSADSHLSLPKDTRSAEQVAKDCEPFRAVQSDMVMLAHLQSDHYQGITTYSKQAVDDARGGDPNRFVLTDCLSMGAITKDPGYTPKRAIVKAMEAGVDGVIFLHQDPDVLLEILQSLPDIGENRSYRANVGM